MGDPVRGEVPEVADGPEYALNFREQPERYRHTTGEEGAFKIEPYKRELLPLWTVAELDAAAEAAQAVHEQYRTYRAADDFVGMDMARKYLQMGWTRAMRYAKYPGGRKYGDGGEREPEQWYDPEKRRIARIYRFHLDRVRADPDYQRAVDAHRERYGGG